jgi:integrase
MSYGTSTVNVHKKLRLDKRLGSDNWYARLTLDNGKRIVKSTKTDNLDEARERALELYYDTQARIKNKLPAQTPKFKHVAEHVIKRMQNELNEGSAA